MKTTKKWRKMFLVGMTVLILAFGFTAVGCETFDDFAYGYSQGRGWLD